MPTPTPKQRLALYRKALDEFASGKRKDRPVAESDEFRLRSPAARDWVRILDGLVLGRGRE